MRVAGRRKNAKPIEPVSVVPDAGLTTRFRADVAGALGRPIDAGDRLALAVSGGPDSMAMLALAAAAFPGLVIAARLIMGCGRKRRMKRRWSPIIARRLVCPM